MQYCDCSKMHKEHLFSVVAAAQRILLPCGKCTGHFFAFAVLLLSY